ncbi:MAG: hypothetical protein ACTTIC_08460 [Helicobacteraceae bacterium]
MKKIFFFLVFVSLGLSVDLILGAHYGLAKGDFKSYKTKWEDGLGYKAGLDFSNTRVIFSVDKQEISKTKESKLLSGAWHAISAPDPLTRGFIGIGYGEIKAQDGDKTASSKALGLEFGFLLDEEGSLLKYLEMEIGFKYYTAKPFSKSDDAFQVKDYMLGHIGLSLKI